MRIGFLHSVLRQDEKLLIAEFNRRKNIELVMLDDRRLLLELNFVIEKLIQVLKTEIAITRA